MSYQDEWVNGRVVRKGYRECERRYEIVRGVCASLRRRDFTVCDIGANLCYFGIRLAEDFPGADILAFESHVAAYSRAQALIAENGTKRLELRCKRLRLSDVGAMSLGRGFDVVLALSVLHHVAGDTGAWLSSLQGLGSVVIVEAAGQDSHRVAAKGMSLPPNAVLLGMAPSHLNPAVSRSIYMLSGGMQ